MSRTAQIAAADAYLSYALAMSEIDDLRRIAYGRPTSPAEEAAASEARVRLARLEQPRPAESDEPAARVHRDAPVAGPAVGSVDGLATVEADGEIHGDPDADADTDADADADEPGYLRRLAASWRVWAAPAAVAFVVGVALAAASIPFVLDATNPPTAGPGGTTSPPATGTAPPSADASLRSTPAPVESATPPDAGVPGGGTLAIESAGDPAAASAVLGRAQQPGEVVPGLDDAIDSRTTRSLGAISDGEAFAATSERGEICLVAVTAGVDISCVPPNAFAAGGVVVGRLDDGVSVRLRWDGVTVAEITTVQ